MSIDRSLDEMNRMLEEMSGRMWNFRPGRMSGEISRESNAGFHFDMVTEEDEYIVTADLPGFEKDEIEITFDDNVLRISAEHEVTEEDEHFFSTRSAKRYESVRVPGEVVEDEITARYHNGVLEIRLPMTEEKITDSHRIEIED